MSTIKDAWMIIRKDFRSEKHYLVWTFVFAAYIGFFISFLVSGQLESSYNNPLTDAILLMIIPALSFYFSRRSFKYINENSYTQMLAYFRMLPISPKVVIGFRIIQLVIALVINSIIFFSMMYAIAVPLRKELSMSSFIAFALTWIGYAVLMSGPYIYAEFLKSGKKLCLLSFLAIPFMILISVIIKLCGGNLLLYTVQSSNQWGLLSPLLWGMLIVGIVCLVVCSKITMRKLQKRDLI